MGAVREVYGDDRSRRQTGAVGSMATIVVLNGGVCELYGGDRGPESTKVVGSIAARMVLDRCGR